MKKKNARFFVDNDSLCCHGAVIFLALSAVFCLIGSLGNWTDRFFVASQVILPVTAAVLFVLFLKLFGRRLFWLTCIPAVFGLAFFVIKALAYGRVLYSVISVALSILAAVLYTAVVFGWIKAKWPLIPIFIAGFFFHIFVSDLGILKNPGVSVSFSGVMQEMSMLFMILAMLFVSFAMKNRRSIESMGLPKIRAPKVIVKKDKEASAEQAADDVSGKVPEKAEEAKAETLPEAQKAGQLESPAAVSLPEPAAASDTEAAPRLSEKTENENSEITHDTGAKQ